MPTHSGAAGLAALSICESILLSMTDNGIIDVQEARVILEDAAIAHRSALALVPDGANHAGAAAIIESIIEGGNSVRRRK